MYFSFQFSIIWHVFQEKLSEVRDLLVIKRYGLDDLEARVDPSTSATGNIFSKSDPVTVDSLVIGALESAFFQMVGNVSRWNTFSKFDPVTMDSLVIGALESTCFQI